MGSLDGLTPQQLYEYLSKYVMTAEQRKEFSFPLRDAYDGNRAVLPAPDVKNKQDFSSVLRTCRRCQKVFVVDEHGVPLCAETCSYHSGRLWPRRFSPPIYSCCNGFPSSGGCCSNKYHVVDGSYHPEYLTGYVRTQPIYLGLHGFYGIYALDCEMVSRQFHFCIAIFDIHICMYN